MVTLKSLETTEGSDLQGERRHIGSQRWSFEDPTARVPLGTALWSRWGQKDPPLSKEVK